MARVSLLASTAMELIIFKAADAHPEPHQFDGPVSVLLASTIAGPAEEVPGFNTISDHGVHRLLRHGCKA
jgi:hypothetical protein